MTLRLCLAQTTLSQKVQSGGFGHWQGTLIPLDCQLSAVPNCPIISSVLFPTVLHRVIEMVRKRQTHGSRDSGWAGLGPGPGSFQPGAENHWSKCCLNLLLSCATPKAKSTDPPDLPWDCKLTLKLDLNASHRHL